MIRDAQHIIDYATKEDGLNYSIENTIVVGRSMGTGVAVQLAVRYPELRGMVLISAFTSVRDVANSVAGSLSKIIIPDIFQSLDIIEQVMVPTLFIHGKKDEVIPYIHSIKLHDQCGSEIKRLELRDLMDHNRCKLEKDLFEPIERFLRNDLAIKDLRSPRVKPLIMNISPEEEDDEMEIQRSRTTQFEKSQSREGSLIGMIESLPGLKISKNPRETMSDTAL